MKSCAVILLYLAILVGTAHQAFSLQPSDLRNMTCQITTPNTKGCTGIPTLQSGVLIISKDGTFELNAHYDGCFFKEDVTKSGQFDASHSKKSMSLELLSTKTFGVKGTSTDFPRTLGFANLNYKGLDGYLVDLSAVIRARGRDTKEVTSSNLQCEVNE